MSRRCKAGQRARIIASGPNKGKIVLVVRRYFGEYVSGGTWPEALFPWVVTSLGAPLSWTGMSDGRRGVAATVVFDDCDLEPLNDDDDGLTRTTDQSLSTPKSIVKIPGAPQGVHEPRPDLKNPEVRAFLSAPKASRADTSRRIALPEFRH